VNKIFCLSKDFKNQVFLKTNYKPERPNPVSSDVDKAISKKIRISLRMQKMHLNKKMLSQQYECYPANCFLTNRCVAICVDYWVKTGENDTTLHWSRSE